MAMLDYGALLQIDNILVNKNKRFLDMEYEVGYSMEDVSGDYFVYFGDINLTFCIYKTQVLVLSNKEILDHMYVDLYKRFTIHQEYNGVKLKIKRLEYGKYLLTTKYKGKFYRCVFGYGIDSDFNIYKWCVRKKRYGYNKKIVKIMNEMFRLHSFHYRNGLPKPKKDYKHLPLKGEKDFWSTNIDGVPYVCNMYDDLIANGKYHLEDGLYTLKKINENNKSLEFRPVKFTDLNTMSVKYLEEYKDILGIKKINPNYIFSDEQLMVNGKLSKNQTFKMWGLFYVVDDLIKEENGIVRIIHSCTLNNHNLLPVYPYKEKGIVIDWYQDIQGVWVRQAEEYNKEKEVM